MADKQPRPDEQLSADSKTTDQKITDTWTHFSADLKRQTNKFVHLDTNHKPNYMTTIKFSDTELTDLKSFYQLELENTLKRVADIKGLLSKLNSRQTTNGTTVYAPPIGKNYERTYNKGIPWNSFIADTLKQQDKFLQSRQLYNIALQRFKITNPKEQKMALRNLQGHLQRMNRRNEIIMKTKKGQHARLFGLTSVKDKK